MTAPIIGITTYGRVERPAPSAHYDAHFASPVDYVDAVRRAGGVPLLMPPGEPRWSRWLDAVDGLVVSGGTDVQPQRYGGATTHDVQPGDAERDESELALSLGVLERDLPALFICRGMQVLNVALGGTLHPHIPALGLGDIHRAEDGLWIFHDIDAVAGSRIADAMATESAKPCSGHHQGIDRIAADLTVTATAPDGVVEAVEVTDATWAVAVQWHPEVSAADDPSQQGIFDALAVVAGAAS